MYECIDFVLALQLRLVPKCSHPDVYGGSIVGQICATIRRTHARKSQWVLLLVITFAYMRTSMFHFEAALV